MKECKTENNKNVNDGLSCKCVHSFCGFHLFFLLIFINVLKFGIYNLIGKVIGSRFID